MFKEQPTNEVTGAEGDEIIELTMGVWGCYCSGFRYAVCQFFIRFAAMRFHMSKRKKWREGTQRETKIDIGAKTSLKKGAIICQLALRTNTNCSLTWKEVHTKCDGPCQGREFCSVVRMT